MEKTWRVKVAEGGKNTWSLVSFYPFSNSSLMFQFYSKPQPIVLCGLELHRGRASGKKEGQEIFDTMEPRGEKLCEAANISALLSPPHSLQTFLFWNTRPLLLWTLRCWDHFTINSGFKFELSSADPSPPTLFCLAFLLSACWNKYFWTVWGCYMDDVDIIFLSRMKNKIPFTMNILAFKRLWSKKASLLTNGLSHCLKLRLLFPQSIDPFCGCDWLIRLASLNINM